MEQHDVDGIITLAESGRVADALETLDAILAEVRDEPRLHALRAFLLLELDRFGEAQRSADLAMALDDEDPYVLNAVGRVAIAAGEPIAALEASRQLRTLDPEDESALLIEARALAMLGKWDEVTARAEYVLAGDPSNAEAAFLRIAAIESRKRGGQSLDAEEWTRLAERFPHLGVARAGRAWALLQGGGARAAEAEFRDALALDPSNAWAKEGLVLALKARYPGYTLLLRFFFWLRTLPSGMQTGVIFGGVIVTRLLLAVAKANPSIAIACYALIALYVGFVLLTWLADPLLDLALMANAEGRRLLSKDDRQGATLVGGALATGAIIAALGWFTPWGFGLLTGVAVAFTSLTIAAAYKCAPGKYRNRLLGTAAFCAVCGVVSGIPSRGAGVLFFAAAVLGVVLSTWISQSFIRKSHGE